MADRGIDVVLVDHYDSYTWNLAHLIASVTGVVPRVVEHDQISAAAVLEHEFVVLSPGPGHPRDRADFAVGREVLLAGTRPVFGVCLGMQGIVETFGGEVAQGRPAHGEVTAVRHDGAGVFAALPQGFAAVRYHSLRAVELPDDVVATAWADDDAVMGVRHVNLPIEGVQFHPESVLSEHGQAMIANFLGVR